MTAPHEAPTLDECIEWAKSLVNDARMPNRFRAVHKAVLASLERLRAIENAKGMPETPRTAALMARQFDEARKIKDGIPREEIAAAWIDLAMLLESELAEAKAYGDRMESAYKIAHQQAMENGQKYFEAKAEAERERGERRSANAVFVEDRGVREPCDSCGGYGARVYGSTATWRRGIGGQAITTDVCDVCWGSGDKIKHWPSHREFYALKKRAEKAESALAAEQARCRELGAVVRSNLPYLENLILLRGHESGLLKQHPAPCSGKDFCLMKQAQKGADSIHAAIDAATAREGGEDGIQ